MFKIAFLDPDPRLVNPVQVSGAPCAKAGFSSAASAPCT
ncbi:hypothetical protein L195_g061599, partial [Trifolium pratense]